MHIFQSIKLGFFIIIIRNEIQSMFLSTVRAYGSGFTCVSARKPQILCFQNFPIMIYEVLFISFSSVLFSFEDSRDSTWQWHLPHFRFSYILLTDICPWSHFYICYSYSISLWSHFISSAFFPFSFFFRYIYYFGGLLSGAIKMNSSPLFLHQVLIPSLPNFQGEGGVCTT